MNTLQDNNSKMLQISFSDKSCLLLTLTFSILAIALLRSSEYCDGILLKLPSLIFTERAAWLAAVNGGLQTHDQK